MGVDLEQTNENSGLNFLYMQRGKIFRYKIQKIVNTSPNSLSFRLYILSLELLSPVNKLQFLHGKHCLCK